MTLIIFTSSQLPTHSIALIGTFKLSAAPGSTCRKDNYESVGKAVEGNEVGMVVLSMLSYALDGCQ